MQIVFVVTAGKTDLFAQMARVSTAAVRLVEPAARVTVVCDDELTYRSDGGIRALLGEVDLVVARNAGTGDPGMRSRYLKTSLRGILPGAFLYLDVDAVPIQPLGEFEKIAGDAAGCLDRNQAAAEYVIAEWAREMYGRLEWSLPLRYFNGGVMYWKDSPAAHKLGASWHDLWRQTSALGRVEDQPGLNRAIDTTAADVIELPRVYNAMIHWRREMARDAKIIHFFTSCWESKDDCVFHYLVEGLRRNGTLDRDRLKRFVETGYPWVDETWISGQLACGNYLQATALALRKVGERCLRRRTATPQASRGGSVER